MIKEIIFYDKETEKLLDSFVSDILNSEIDFSNVAIVGIKNGGIPFVEVLKDAVLNRLNIKCETGFLSMTLYRDDPFSVRKTANTTELPFNIDGKEILLIDDVISSGRTVRASIDEIFDFGRPARIWLAVFIDKGGRELPICPDFIGKKIKAGKNETIKVDIASREKLVEKIMKQ